MWRRCGDLGSLVMRWLARRADKQRLANLEPHSHIRADSPPYSEQIITSGTLAIEFVPNREAPNISILVNQLN